MCKDWPDSQMRSYVKLQDGKGRKKAHKERKKAAKLAAGLTADGHSSGNAHSLSPSISSVSSSQSEIGELVPSPVVAKPEDRLGFAKPLERLGSVDVVSNLGGGNVLGNKDISVACSPSVPPPQAKFSGDLGQGSGVPCGSKTIALSGNVDPVPWMVSEEIPAHMGQPPQALPRPDLGAFKTPASSASFRSRKSSGSARLTPGAYSALRGVLEDHKEATDDEKLHLMLQKLIETDPTFKGSLRSSRSSRSQATDSARSRVEKVGKSAGLATHSSVSEDKLLVRPIVGVSEQEPDRMELTREWAHMVETGGVSVKQGTSYYFKDKKGEEQFVNPRTVRHPEGGSLKQKLKSVAPSAVLESSPSGGVASGIAKKVLQSQGSGGV